MNPSKRLCVREDIPIQVIDPTIVQSDNTNPTDDSTDSGDRANIGDGANVGGLSGCSDSPIRVIVPTPSKDVFLVMETMDPKITFLWAIRGINNVAMRQKLKQIRSSRFSLIPGQPKDWDVTIKFLDNDTFQMSLACRSKIGCVIRVDIDASLQKDNDRMPILVHKEHYVFCGMDEQVIMPETLNVTLQDWGTEELFFLCKFQVIGYELNSLNLNEDDVYHEKQLRAEYLSIFKSKELADVKIKVEDSEFSAHKCVLKHLAPQFFKKHEKKILDGELTLQDVKPRRFEKHLLDIYYGDFETIVQRDMTTTDDGANVGDCALGGDHARSGDHKYSEDTADSEDTTDSKDTTDSEEYMLQ